MDLDAAYRRYQELQAWLGWTEESARRVAATADLLAPHLAALVDDFYDEIDRHPQARKVITGGRVQINRLKGTLIQWLRELLGGRYDRAYVARRWQVGWRHVEIGLEQVYANAALCRLRIGLVRALQDNWRGDLPDLQDTLRSLNKLIDLDLAIIEDAYQAEYASRLQRGERLAEHAFVIVLIDMKLPRGDGGRVFERVRGTNPEARTVVITGHRAEMDPLVQRVLAEGADAVCYKPFDVPRLLSTLEKLTRSRSDQ